MTELEQICENALYDVIRVLEDGKSIVRDVPTGRLYFKKTLDVYNTQVFAYLREHRSRYVPAIQAFWNEGDKLVVIEELVQGRTLDELLSGELSEPGQVGSQLSGSDSEGGELDFAERISILTQICDGLQFLHSAEPPIIHRDIKASNIMVTDDGIVKIIDYDAAKIFITGQKKDTIMIGTQGLAAPEQYGFAQSDVRTDLYALGKLIESMLPDNADAKRIADKATQMDPKKRYTSAAQMKQQIMRIREKPSLVDRKLEKIPGYDPMNREHRIRARIAVVACIAAAVLLVGFVGWRCFVYPAKMTEEIRVEMEAIAGDSDYVTALGMLGDGNSAAAPEVSEGEIPGAVRRFVTAHSYQKMNAAQKKVVCEGMEFAVARCYAAGYETDAQKVREILTENYGDKALWEAVYNYGKADWSLVIGEFEAGLAALHKCVEEDAPDADEHWEKGITMTREAVQRSMETFRERLDADSLHMIVSAGKALDKYDSRTGKSAGEPGETGAEPAGNSAENFAGELDGIYQEILDIAASKREAHEFDTAIEIYTMLRDAETSEADDLSELIAQTRYEQAEAALAEESYSAAASVYAELGGYRDAPDKRRESLYRLGAAEQGNGNYELAAAAFEEIAGYKDAEERGLLAKYSYCKATASEPTETTYAFFEALDDNEYEGAEELREEIYKWHVTFETGMSYSFGPMQSAYVKATLSGGQPDAVTTVTFRIDDPTRGEFDVWTDDKQYSSGDTVEISYSEEDSTYNLFDRTYKVSVYADNDELIGVWEGQFGS